MRGGGGAISINKTGCFSFNPVGMNGLCNKNIDSQGFLSMNNNSLNLLYFVRSDTCFLLNQGDQTIEELEFENGSYGLDSGFFVGNDYGRYLVRNFVPKTFFKVYELTQKEVMYLPRSRWFQLDIHRCLMANGSVYEKLMLKSVGGYKPEAEFVEFPMEKVVQNSE